MPLHRPQTQVSTWGPPPVHLLELDVGRDFGGDHVLPQLALGDVGPDQTGADTQDLRKLDELEAPSPDLLDPRPPLQIYVWAHGKEDVWKAGRIGKKGDDARTTPNELQNIDRHDRKRFHSENLLLHRIDRVAELEFTHGSALEVGGNTLGLELVADGWDHDRVEILGLEPEIRVTMAEMDRTAGQTVDAEGLWHGPS